MHVKDVNCLVLADKKEKITHKMHLDTVPCSALCFCGQ